MSSNGHLPADIMATILQPLEIKETTLNRRRDKAFVSSGHIFMQLHCLNGLVVKRLVRAVWGLIFRSTEVAIGFSIRFILKHAVILCSINLSNRTNRTIMMYITLSLLAKH